MISEAWESFRESLYLLAEAKIWAWRLNDNGAHWGMIKLVKVEFDYLQPNIRLWWSFADEVKRMNSLGDDDEGDWDNTPEVYQTPLNDLYPDRFTCLAALKVKIMAALPSSDAIESMQTALKQAEGE